MFSRLFRVRIRAEEHEAAVERTETSDSKKCFSFSLHLQKHFNSLPLVLLLFFTFHWFVFFLYQIFFPENEKDNFYLVRSLKRIFMTFTIIFMIWRANENFLIWRKFVINTGIKIWEKTFSELFEMFAMTLWRKTRKELCKKRKIDNFKFFTIFRKKNTLKVAVGSGGRRVHLSHTISIQSRLVSTPFCCAMHENLQTFDEKSPLNLRRQKKSTKNQHEKEKWRRQEVVEAEEREAK